MDQSIHIDNEWRPENYVSLWSDVIAIPVGAFADPAFPDPRVEDLFQCRQWVGGSVED